MAKSPSRATRWADAVSQATSGLETLIELQSEYQDWRSNLPENLDGSPVAEKLDAICDLDIESTLSEVQEFDGFDLPLGFGRD